MIIWGSTTKEKVVDMGTFYCPTCRQESEYSLVCVAQYFTLYFLPVCRTSTLGEFVECRSCGQSYEMDVLSYNAENYEPRPSWQCACKNINPGDYDQCMNCHSWLCANCGRCNSSELTACLRCRGHRGPVAFH